MSNKNQEIEKIAKISKAFKCFCQKLQNLRMRRHQLLAQSIKKLEEDRIQQIRKNVQGMTNKNNHAV